MYARVKTASATSVQHVRKRVLIVANGFVVVKWHAVTKCEHPSNYAAVPTCAYIAAVVRLR